MEAAPSAGRESVYLARRLQCSVMMCRLIESPRVGPHSAVTEAHLLSSIGRGGPLCQRTEVSAQWL